MNVTSCEVGEKRGVTTSSFPRVRYFTLPPSWSITARRLRRFSAGPDSSTNTTRESKKPFSPVIRVKMASEMMWPTRRELLAVGRILLAGDLLAVGHVPQAELGLEAPVTLAVAAARDDELRTARLPGRDLRRLGVHLLLGEGGGVGGG